MQGQVNAVMFRPSRLNFAGVCIFCGQVGCAALRCVRRHERTWWAPCAECWAGLAGIDGAICISGCAHGVIVYSSKSAAEEAAREFLALVAVPEALRNDVLRFPTLAEGLAAVQRAQAHGSGEVLGRVA